MGLRKLTDKERKATRWIASGMLARYEHKDDVCAGIARYLRMHGWQPGEAKRRGLEEVYLAAERMERSEPGDRSERRER